MELFLSAQKYNFESKSQRLIMSSESRECCFFRHKNTILKANHNRAGVTGITWLAVSFGTKIQFWKQITTGTTEGLRGQMLFLSAQKYNFESKSQQALLDANYQAAVSFGTKIQFWKQITTTFSTSLITWSLFLSAQKYNFESKSQLEATYNSIGTGCFFRHKNTILKANHNPSGTS